MRPYFLSVLLLQLIATTVSAQRLNTHDTAKAARNYNGIHGTDYISAGISNYSGISTRHLSVNIELLAEYRHEHFYANAGLGGYLMTADVPQATLYGSLVPMSKFLIALPVGVGFVTTNRWHTTLQFGVDVPYLSEIDFSAKERGFGFAPRFSIVHDSKKRKRAAGLMCNTLINLQKKDEDTYDPFYLGVGLFVRYY